MPSTIDCKADFSQLISKAADNDADEILVRVSQFDNNLEATRWQAIVRFRNRTRQWAVAVEGKPELALRKALTEAALLEDPEKVSKNGSRTRKRTGVLRRVKTKPRGKSPSVTGGSKTRKPVRRVKK